jgi:hypothetical protein
MQEILEGRISRVPRKRHDHSGQLPVSGGAALLRAQRNRETNADRTITAGVAGTLDHRDRDYQRPFGCSLAGAHSRCIDGLCRPKMLFDRPASGELHELPMAFAALHGQF